MEHNELYPETVDDALSLWDSGRGVWSVEMGGIGPGYEQAIQVLAFELMRHYKALDWSKPEEIQQEIKDICGREVRKLTELGFSGAQVGAASNLAAVVCRRGYRKALSDPKVKDRLIQVENSFTLKKSLPSPEAKQ